MRDFVHRQNVDHYWSLLATDSDTAKQIQLRNLLVSEMEQFGSLARQLDETEAFILKGQVQLRDQRQRIAALGLEGQDTSPASRMLECWSETVALLEARRLRLQNEIDAAGGLGRSTGAGGGSPELR